MNTILKNVLFLVVLAGCKEQATEPGTLTPYEKWRSYTMHDYTIDQVRTCFCVYGGEKMRVTVRSDTVASVMRLIDSSYIPSPSAKYYLTIDSLFGIIRYSTADSLVIVYDAQYGYPKSLDIDPQFHPFDGGVLYETSALKQFN